MKILIVDDIADNREMLEKLVKRYSSKTEGDCEIFQAENGQDAVYLCEQESMDLIFMDIVMPVMDGLEATQQIKKISPNSMIVVISSENDEATKTKILQEGAEDYILKPFSSAIMLSRLNNYHKLIASRNSIGFQCTAVNTFTRNVYNYQTRFLITNEDELAQFWETLLVRLEYQNVISNLSDIVRFLYYLGSYQLQKSYKFHVIIEEDEENFYFSMDNVSILSEEVMQKGIAKFCSFFSFNIEGNWISFATARCNKKCTAESQSETQQQQQPQTAVVKIEPKEEVVLRTYDILDADTRGEFEHVVAKLKTEISLMGSSSLEIDDIDTIHEYIKHLVNMLGACPDAYTIAEALRGFSGLLEDHSETFLEKSQELAGMVKAFVNDIETWKDMVFYTGAPSVDFLDNSISSSVEMIKAVFVEEGSSQEELDDIFDF